MRLLITGGLGNLGLWLTHYFLDKGYSVSVLGRKEKVKINHNNYTFISSDISDYEILNQSISMHYDFCIHAASYNEHFNENYTKDSLLINALGTENLCKVLTKNGIGKFIYLSTVHVYGVNHGLVNENNEIRPTNDYALTHFFAEKYIEKNSIVNGLKYTIFRLSNSYGCPINVNTDKWYLLLNDLCKQAFDDGEINLLSNGKALRDFIWVGDVARVIEASLESESKFSGLYNLSSAKSLSVFDVCKCVQEVFFELYNRDLDIYINEKDITEPEFLYLSNEKLKKVFEYEFCDNIKEEAKKIFFILEKK